MALSSVDLPAPLGPMIPTSSPFWSSSSQPRRMSTPGHVAGHHVVGGEQRADPVVLGDGVEVDLDRRERGVVSHRRPPAPPRWRPAAAAELRLLLGGGERRVVVGTEVGVDHGVVGADLVGRALGDDPALAHHDHPVGDVVHDVHVVLHEHHRHPVVAQRLHVLEQRLGERRVHAGHRLVEHHHGRARPSAPAPSRAACAGRPTASRRTRRACGRA